MVRNNNSFLKIKCSLFLVRKCNLSLKKSYMSSVFTAITSLIYIKKTYWASTSTFNWLMRLSTHDNSTNTFHALVVEHFPVFLHSDIVSAGQRRWHTLTMHKSPARHTLNNLGFTTSDGNFTNAAIHDEK
jgi:hypothetical protein